jgi:cell division protein FtsI/penicillin-binding protein 2
LFARQETPGHFPTLDRVNARDWHDGDTANLCIGQGELAVTPIQMAVMVSAIANGGTVLKPRIVSRIEPQDPTSGEVTTNYPSGMVRDHLTVHPRSLQILRNAMLADVESSEGTGTAAAVDGLQICGKTGTAQVQDSANHFLGYNFWFASFAPYENPKYAVVVMVQGQRGSGGVICAPVAHDIYEAILKKENAVAVKNLASVK